MSAPDRFVLATDLDGTFAHGRAASRERLVAALGRLPAATLVYVTGRSVVGARELAERTPLPEPDVLVADVGTSVLRGLGPERVVEIEAELDAIWPGEAEVRERLAGLAALAPQDVEAPRRVSYWVEPVRRMDAAASGDDAFAARAPGAASLGAEAERVAEATAAAARERLAGLDVDVLVSANVFLDVLPRGVDKGSTLRRVLEWLGAPDGTCVVAGDSLNDLALFRTGLRGIAVGNCEPALRRSVAELASVYQASAEGVDGVIEGLSHHGVVDVLEGGGEGHGE